MLNCHCKGDAFWELVGIHFEDCPARFRVGDRVAERPLSSPIGRVVRIDDKFVSVEYAHITGVIRFNPKHLEKIL